MSNDHSGAIHHRVNRSFSMFICGLMFLAISIPTTADEESRLDSADFIELRDGLANAQIRFAPGHTARVAFLGGSITQMTGWRDLVCDDFKARFPETTFDFVQAGVASMGSTPGAFRLMRDVFGRGPVDLLFVEAAVNDSTNYRSSIDQIRGMEGIVRHARTINPNIDIILLHFVDPGKMETYTKGETPEVIANHERVAEHYGVPSIDLAREVTERIAAKEFTWKDDFKNLHPSPFGHEVYRRSIQRLFDLAWAEPTTPNATLTPHAVPNAQLDPYSYTEGRIVDINNATDLDSFSVVANWAPDDHRGTRPGFVHVPMLNSKTPGASFQFRFKGSAVGLWVAAGPDAGVIEYQIDGGPTSQVDLYTPWSPALHLPWAYILSAELDEKPHTLTVKVATPASDRQHGGTAVRIAHFLVNG